jgi:PKD repeat protein
VADHPALELERSSTLIAVFAPDVTSTQQTLVSKHSDSNAAGAYFGAMLVNGKLGVDRPWKQTGPRSTGAVTAGGFHLVVIRVSGTRVDMRINRAAVGSGILDAGVASDKPLRIGVLRHRSSSVLEFSLKGRVADLLIFDTGLADAHVQEWEEELYATHLQNSAPVASISYAPSSPGTGETVRFDGSGSSDADGSITQYAWNFGDGASGTGVKVEHAYAAAGSYDVTLTVADNFGATGQTTQAVTVSATASGLKPVAALRLNAENLSGLADNTPVATWADPVAGLSANAPTSSAQAIYRTAQTPGGTAAVHFKGDDYYEVADHPTLELDRSSTLIAVFAPDATSTQQTLISKHSDSNAAGAYFGAMFVDGKVGVDRPWKQTGPRSTGAVTAGGFRLVVIRVSGTRVDLRINGASVGSGFLDPGVASDKPLRIGVLRHRSTSVLEFFLKGRMADLLIFDTGLADAHVQEWEEELHGTHLQNSLPVASISYAPGSPGTGETVRFDGSGSSDANGSITQYAWNFGDGTSGTGVKVEHAYAAAGSYGVTLTVTDNFGATGQATQTVTVSATASGPKPTAALRLNAENLSGLADNTPVATWADPVTGLSASAPTNSARAIYRTAQTPSRTAAVHFQGNDYYEVADHPALELERSSTLIAVFAPDATSTQQTLISKHSDSNAAGAYFGAMFVDGKIGVDRPWKQAGPRSTGALTAGGFHLVVIRVSGTRVDLRINGSAVGSGALDAGGASDKPLRIGVMRHRSSSVLEFFLKGRVADLLIFDTGLADAHVKEWEEELHTTHLMNSAAVASYSGAQSQVTAAMR